MREADAIPEPASLDPEKSAAAAETAAHEVEAQWAALQAYLPEAERARFQAQLDELEHDAQSRLDMIKAGADCLAMAVGESTPLSRAQAAIAHGAPREAVAQRLLEAGHDVSGL